MVRVTLTVETDAGRLEVQREERVTSGPASRARLTRVVIDECATAARSAVDAVYGEVD